MKPTTFKVGEKECIAFIRKLTEKECFRLMGVDDADIEKIVASGISRSAMYKLAGNSIVVDVLYYIYRNMFIPQFRGNQSAQMSIFDIIESDYQRDSYDNKHPLRVVTLCSGYDSQCLALERLKRDFPPFDYELVAWSEFDPESTTPLEKQPAVIAHNALFPQWADRNLGDMTKIDWEKVGDFDFLFYSTPCQSISQAGLQHGFVEGSGTRSSIIWNVRDAIRIKKPKYACLENVAAMVSEKFMPMFNLWRDTLRELGYENTAEVLNAKYYGVPQNRERIFLLSIQDDTHSVQYHWPERIPLKHTLKDVLFDEVDIKYFLNPVKVDKFVKDNLVMIKNYAESSDEPIEKLPDYLREWIESLPDEEVEEVKEIADNAPVLFPDEDGSQGDISEMCNEECAD